MAVVSALLLVLAEQAAFWALLHGETLLAALAANAVFWFCGFPIWTIAGRRWWRGSATPDIALCLTLLLVTAATFYAGQGLADAAYCTGVYPDQRGRCWVTEASRDAFLWLGMVNVPVALIAAALATLRVRALRVGTAAGPEPVTALVIAAVILVVALIGFAVLIVANVGPPR